MTERGLESGGARGRSVAMLVLVWLVLQLGGIFSPGLLDDVDSVYTEVAREMLHRHDYVTPYVDGIRFFDKPPLMYWLAAGSMKVFGEHDWAARIPIAVAMLGLMLAVYGLGKRFYGERGGFYGALVLGTAIGPYLYTRFFIPDVLICLWMTLGVWFFLLTLDSVAGPSHVSEARHGAPRYVAGFGCALGLNLLTKGLIGVVFPLGFVAVYVVVTRQVGLLLRMKLWVGALVLAVVAVPWHVLAWLWNPPIAMAPGLGLPAKAGWGWFYLYNEHVARFLGKRVPHDYGNTPVWLFWVYALVWMLPWVAFLPAAIGLVRRQLGHHYPVSVRAREAGLTVVIWAGVVLVFFSVSNRQEYYSLPALPAVALMLGGALAAGGAGVRRYHAWVLVPIALVVMVVCGWFAVMAPGPLAGVDLSGLLVSHPQMYNVSLGHLFDLTGRAMGIFRGPLAAVAVGMLVAGPLSFRLRRRSEYGANLVLAGGMVVVLLAAHVGLVRFNPILGSKGLAEAILEAQRSDPRAGDLIVVDGEMTSGSTLLFYTGEPVHLVNGRVNGPWFGSMWPDTPHLFEDEASLKKLWAGPERVFLMTYDAGGRERELGGRVLASAGGKTVLVNR